jgi:hypothetical protein
MEHSRVNDEPREDAETVEIDPAAYDTVLDVFKRDIDFTLVERNLRLTIEERALQLVNATRFINKSRPLA